MSTKLLIIDPDIAFMVSLKQGLEGTGDFEVSVSGNGMAAREALRHDRHDVALVAFDLLDMDVMQLIMEMRTIQPDLPVVMAPEGDDEQDRVRFMDAQGSIRKPFTARDLIPYVRSVLTRVWGEQVPPSGESRVRGDDFVPPQMPAAIQDLIKKSSRPPGTPSPTELLDQVERDKLPPRDDVLEEFEVFEPGQTRLLDDDPNSANPPATTRLLQWEETEQTASLGETRTLDPDQRPTRETLDWQDEADPHGDSLDHLMVEQGWFPTQTPAKDGSTHILPPMYDEPPLSPGDTPTFPTDGMNGPFVAPKRIEQDPVGIEDVLDVIAQTPPAERETSDFDHLVDSMRRAEERRPPSNRLETLLASIAADTARHEDEEIEMGDTALDYVLDAIRHNKPLAPTIDESEADNTTIAEVLEGLFDPSFEGVLAAMAGQEVSESDFEEPTYTTTAQEGGAAAEDRFTLDDMTPDEDMPEWLRAYEEEGIEPPSSLPEEGPRIVEPPITSEDSSGYPATTALTAVKAADEDADFSLDDLLIQIGRQLPPDHTRPRLKPLPSWNQEELRQDDQLAAMFDRFEGVAPEPEAPVESEAIAESETLAESEAITGEIDTWIEGEVLDEQDTRPSTLIAAQQREPEPESEPEPEPEFEPEFELESESEPESEPEFELEPESEPQYEPEPKFELEPEEDLSYTFSDLELPEVTLSPEDLLAIADDPPEEFVEDDSYVEAFYAGIREEAAEPDDSHLIPVPVEDAARLLSGEDDAVEAIAEEADEGAIDDEEDARLARAAVQLTQFSLESSAQATLLARADHLLASAGELPDDAIQRLFEVVHRAWQKSPDDSDSLIRFISLPEVGEFLLYSTLVEGDLSLSMVFHANTPVRTIRRQARRLSESLEYVSDEEADATATQPSHPTDLRPPQGWSADSLPARPPRPAEPYTSYTCLWLPTDPGMELVGDLAENLAAWIQDIVQENAWEVSDLAVQTDYVQLTVSAPQKTLPDTVIDHLMDETAQASAGVYEDIDASTLWADGYYVVSPPRSLTDREIARFITYQRQAQLG